MPRALFAWIVLFASFAVVPAAAQQRAVDADTRPVRLLGV